MTSETSLSHLNVAVGTSTTNNEYHFNLMGQVENPDKYTDLLNTLRTANEGDVVNIHINSYGGSVPTAVQIVNWIEQSKATVVGHLESECHSAATVIFLSCDTWVIYDNCIALFHQYSAGVYGEGHKMKSQLTAIDSWISELNNKYYVNFLTKKELDDMVQGKDFWFTSKEIEARLENYSRARIEEAQQQEVIKEEALVEEAKRILKAKEDRENDSGSSKKVKKCTCK